MRDTFTPGYREGLVEISSSPENSPRPEIPSSSDIPASSDTRLSPSRTEEEQRPELFFTGQTFSAYYTD